MKTDTHGRGAESKRKNRRPRTAARARHDRETRGRAVHGRRTRRARAYILQVDGRRVGAGRARRRHGRAGRAKRALGADRVEDGRLIRAHESGWARGARALAVLLIVRARRARRRLIGARQGKRAGGRGELRGRRRASNAIVACARRTGADGEKIQKKTFRHRVTEKKAPASVMYRVDTVQSALADCCPRNSCPECSWRKTRRPTRR